MKVVNQYIIPHIGLKEGTHDFDFQIGEAFFEANEALNIEFGQLKATVVLDKKANFMVLDVLLKGGIELTCDRCLDKFTFPLDYSGQLVVKFKEEKEEPDEDVMFLHPNEDFLDLEQYFLDCIGLSIPIQKFHPEDENGEMTCNDNMVSILNAHSSGTNENDGDTIDPRWSKLKDLLNDGNKKE